MVMPDKFFQQPHTQRYHIQRPSPSQPIQDRHQSFQRAVQAHKSLPSSVNSNNNNLFFKHHATSMQHFNNKSWQPYRASI